MHPGAQRGGLVEATPKSIRVRKRVLDHNKRKQWEKSSGKTAAANE